MHNLFFKLAVMDSFYGIPKKKLSVYAKSLFSLNLLGFACQKSSARKFINGKKTAIRENCCTRAGYGKGRDISTRMSN